MRRIIVVSNLCFVLCLSCKTAKMNGDLCQKVHSGHFIRTLYNTTGYGHWTHTVVSIDRTNTDQIESTEFPIKAERKYKIEWLSDCVYNLKIYDLKVWADTVIAKMYPKGQRIIITNVTSEYIIEKRVKDISDTLWIRK